MSERGWHNKFKSHRADFDTGALLNDHIAVLGRGNTWLKRRLG